MLLLALSCQCILFFHAHGFLCQTFFFMPMVFHVNLFSYAHGFLFLCHWKTAILEKSLQYFLSLFFSFNKKSLNSNSQRAKFFSEFSWSKLNLDCNYTFPIDLVPDGILEHPSFHKFSQIWSFGQTEIYFRNLIQSSQNHIAFNKYIYVCSLIFRSVFSIRCAILVKWGPLSYCHLIPSSSSFLHRIFQASLQNCPYLYMHPPSSSYKKERNNEWWRGNITSD